MEMQTKVIEMQANVVKIKAKLMGIYIHQYIQLLRKYLNATSSSVRSARPTGVFGCCVMDLNVRGASGGLRKPIIGGSRTCSSARPKTAIRIKVIDMHTKIMEMQTKLMGMHTEIEAKHLSDDKF